MLPFWDEMLWVGNIACAPHVSTLPVAPPDLWVLSHLVRDVADTHRGV